MISLKRKRDLQTIANITHDVQLNQRFRVVLSYSELRHFHDFLFVKQWINVEQKTIVHQLIAIVTSLLIRKASDALYCARALMNFVMMIQYQSHDDESLCYMNNTIYIINVLKKYSSSFNMMRTLTILSFMWSLIIWILFEDTKMQMILTHLTWRSHINFWSKIIMILQTSERTFKCIYCITILNELISWQWKISFFMI